MEKKLSGFNTWLKNNKKNYSSNSIQAYVADITVFSRYLSESGEVLNLTNIQKVFEKFINAEIKNGRNYTTLRRRIASLRRFVEYLAEENEVGQVDYKQLVEMIKNLYKEQATEEVLTQDEIKKIFAFLDDENSGFHKRDDCIFRLLLESGSSIQRILNIELDDLNLEQKEVKLSNDLGEEYILRIEDKTCACLKEYLEEVRANIASSNELSPLFISQQARRISRQAVWQNLKKLGKQTGLPNRLNARVIKNTAVKRILAQDLSIEKVRLMLGHKNALSTYALIRKTRKFSEET